jgi:hypothetical protein
VHGQTLKGIVIDGETRQPLYLANAIDNASSQSTATDEHGMFVLPVKKGDVISFSYIGYHTIRRLANTDSMLTVSMFPLSVSLQEYILHPDYTPYQKDSAEMATRYSTELNKKPLKISFNPANGGGFSGLIGAPVQKLSKSYKQNKKFKENFQKDQEQKFIDTRYTPQLTSALTGFSGDSLAVFMNTYPMEYKFARSATDLEVKMWIRQNYKEYLKPKDRPMPPANSGH